ncbi:Tm-1-like ATP-binding domain-containing protein, partial [Microbispora sp. NPDC049633]|uniref:Tm-1-like ATP-binding domain-containing protein n=1 Tax=Microbispora sp. NPDC049633 TaxID=3154355 RepID=UPI0034316449
RVAGFVVLVVVVGTVPQGGDLAGVGGDEVGGGGGGEVDRLRAARDRGAAMDAMATGAAVIVRRLFEEGRLDGLLAIGGSGGSSVAARALQALPVGVPKLLVSTMASGDVRPYVGDADVTLMYSVVDISGINRLSRAVLGNAAAAVAGMAQRYARVRGETGTKSGTDSGDERKLIGATMFGLTTPAVDEARDHLTGLGYEVLVFHATGSGGRAMEALAASGMLDGVLDLTTTELADDLVGGVLTAGPERLEAAGRAGIPQVVSVGALDMVNFGPRDTVPDRFADRRFLVHNPTVTLMRTTREEMAALGARIGDKLSRATGPVEIYLPTKGVSGIDVEGGPFADPDADAACFTALRDALKDTGVPVHDVDAAINDPGFGRAAAEALHRLISARRTGD